MGIQRKKKSKAGITLTAKKLELLICDFLAEREADMTADYKPEEEQWRQLLSQEIARYILANTKQRK
jgi:hypothetical protein